MSNKRHCFRQPGFYVDSSLYFRDHDAADRIYNALLGESLVGNDPRELPREQLQKRALGNMVALFRSILVNKLFFPILGPAVWDAAAMQVGLHDGEKLSGADALDLLRFMAAARKNYHLPKKRDQTPTSGLGADLAALVDEYIALAAEGTSNSSPA